ncbi:cysteine-rich CPXCG family protein [Formosa agariphila KMM 3901]|uniref:Cysteine-rich CPXCG family protein n=1 Tax=Formosa agariphila (strain DSM 15362 / KCTC 12365 / LMG 23005 / KMM 3901 / M-2Alg 35-1) TaxID=1347342 RepID=T2KH74_FORAG|nr:CPXCG motif-containing cysteine-rich protein [Formosa agariphila]CDF78155.1 cysteine-rich CPXCG family protein [Formosa agariphila KMM 3901]
MYEHFFTCPHCWETISMLLDTGVAKQKYIEDCEVCCNPLEIYTVFLEGELSDFQVNII